MQTFNRLCAAAVLAAAWQISGPVAIAQDQSAAPSDQSTTGVAPPSQNIPDEKLDKAAAALQRVAKLQDDFQQQMERLAEQAREAAAKAVSEQGLSVEEYSQILETAQKDPDLRAKLLQRVNPVETTGSDKGSAPATSPGKKGTDD
jgi:hypothetical protein